MDPVTIAMLLGGLVSAGGSLAGYFANEDKARQQKQLLQQMMDQYAGLAPPSAKELTLGPSALGKIQDNPTLLGDQTGALASLESVIQGGGLSLNDRAALNSIMSNVGQHATARNLGALDQAASRGQAGGGSVLAAQLANNAAANESANMAGTQLAGNAQARALQAMMQKGQLASQIRGQDWGEASAKAEAQDAINRYNATVPQMAYQDQLARLQGMSGATGNVAGWYGQEGQREANMLSGMGNGLGQAAYGAAGYYARQPGYTNPYYPSQYRQDPSGMLPSYYPNSSDQNVAWNTP